MLPSRDIGIGLSTTFEPAAIHRPQRRSRSDTDSTSHSNALPYAEQHPSSSNETSVRHAADEPPTTALPSIAPSTPCDSLDARECDLEQGRATEKPARRSWGVQALELRGCGNVYQQTPTRLLVTNLVDRRAGPVMWAAVRWTFLLLAGQNEPVRNFLVFIGTSLGIFLAVCTIIGRPYLPILGHPNGAFLPLGGAAARPPEAPPQIFNNYHHCTILHDSDGHQVLMWEGNTAENQIPITPRE